MAQHPMWIAAAAGLLLIEAVGAEPQRGSACASLKQAAIKLEIQRQQALDQAISPEPLRLAEAQFKIIQSRAIAQHRTTRAAPIRLQRRTTNIDKPQFDLDTPRWSASRSAANAFTEIPLASAPAKPDWIVASSAKVLTKIKRGGVTMQMRMELPFKPFSLTSESFSRNTLPSSAQVLPAQLEVSAGSIVRRAETNHLYLVAADGWPQQSHLSIAPHQVEGAERLRRVIAAEHVAAALHSAGCAP